MATLHDVEPLLRAGWQRNDFGDGVPHLSWYSHGSYVYLQGSVTFIGGAPTEPAGVIATLPAEARPATDTPLVLVIDSTNSGLRAREGYWPAIMRASGELELTERAPTAGGLKVTMPQARHLFSVLLNGARWPRAGGGEATTATDDLTGTLEAGWAGAAAVEQRTAGTSTRVQATGLPFFTGSPSSDRLLRPPGGAVPSGSRPYELTPVPFWTNEDRAYHSYVFPGDGGWVIQQGWHSYEGLVADFVLGTLDFGDGWRALAGATLEDRHGSPPVGVGPLIGDAVYGTYAPQPRGLSTGFEDRAAIGGPLKKVLDEAGMFVRGGDGVGYYALIAGPLTWSPEYGDTPPTFTDPNTDAPVIWPLDVVPGGSYYRWEVYRLNPAATLPERRNQLIIWTPLIEIGTNFDEFLQPELRAWNDFSGGGDPRVLVNLQLSSSFQYQTLEPAGDGLFGGGMGYFGTGGADAIENVHLYTVNDDGTFGFFEGTADLSKSWWANPGETPPAGRIRADAGAGGVVRYKRYVGGGV